MAQGKVSVIVPTYNRAEILLRSLKLLKKQLNGVDHEVIIIDDGSEEWQYTMMAGYVAKVKRIRLLRGKHAGPAAARNWGIKKASGEILLFINDDTIIGEGFVSGHLKFHQTHTQLGDAVVGSFAEHPDLIDTPIMQWLVNESKLHFDYSKSKMGMVSGGNFWTCNVSVKREFMSGNKLFFDESFSTAAWEDVEFGYRAERLGLRLHFDDRLVAFHYHRFNCEEVMARFYSHGRGMYTLVNKIAGNALPPLSKKGYRLVAKLILAMTGYPLLGRALKSWCREDRVLPNLLMQYLIIGEKIRGWDYESSKQQNLSDISRD